MIAIPKRPAPKRRRQVELLDVVHPILIALNGMPGVWASQNKDIRVLAPGGYVSQGPCHGLGSADVVFAVTCECMTDVEIPAPHVAWCPWADPDFDGVADCVARLGWLECKTARARSKTKDHAARDAHQAAWADAMRRKGHFVAHGIATVEEALAAVERCRRGTDR